MNPRIILVQLNWPIQCHTKQLAISLKKTHSVILYTDRQSLDRSTVDLDHLSYNDIPVIKAPGFNLVLLSQILNKIVRKIIYKIIAQSASLKKIELLLIRLHLKKIINKSDLVIAIEKDGLVAAAYIQKVKLLFYYSLELYFDGQSHLGAFKYIRNKEIQIIENIDGLIIQDPDREESFFDNAITGRLTRVQTIYLPVSLYPRCDSPKNLKYWHKKFSLEERKCVILYFGEITPNIRGLEDFIDAFTSYGDQVALIIHGQGRRSFLASLRSKAKGKPVYFSHYFVPENDVNKLIDSSDIGFCWYSASDDNNRHTAFSSEKIALFLRSGKPIITNETITYDRLYSDFNCGIGCANLRHIGDSLLKILENYSIMSEAALSAFDYYYNMDKNIANLHAGLKRVALRGADGPKIFE